MIHHVPALLQRKSKLLLPRIGMASSRRVHASNFVIPTKYSRLSPRTFWFGTAFTSAWYIAFSSRQKFSPRLPSIRRCSRRPQRIALVPSKLPQPKAKGREGVVRKRARKATVAPRREDGGKQGRCDGWKENDGTKGRTRHGSKQIQSKSWRDRENSSEIDIFSNIDRLAGMDREGGEDIDGWIEWKGEDGTCTWMFVVMA